MNRGGGTKERTGGALHETEGEEERFLATQEVDKDMREKGVQAEI